MLNKYTLLCLTIITHICTAQENTKPCGADELRITNLKANPEIAKAVIKKDLQLEQFTENLFAAQHVARINSTANATYIIPVVFHVIHNYGIENISDAQLKDGLDIVNKTFRKLHPNNSSIVSAFQAIHADCDIEFKLATIDPNGNCHSGINRIASPLTTTGDHRVKSLIHWPPQSYLNVYIVSNASNLAGHAVWPSDADTIPAWDGIVLSHNYVGTIGTSNLNQSVAFAHECGHYLNLHHIWGGNNVPNFYYYPCADPNKNCSIDDLVADTPPTIGWQSCNLSGASCGNTIDNVQNAMDYSYCNIMFTQGQKARMQACLNYTVAGRDKLWQTSNLMATGVYTPTVLCKADFISSKKVICQNATVTFTNTSYNGNITTVSWNFIGGTPSASTLSNPIVTYTNAGNYDVELTVSDGTFTTTTIKQNYITVQALTANTNYPFTESFENTPNLNNGDWLTSNLDTSGTWTLTSNAAYVGSKSIMIDNFNSPINGKDELHSKPINLTGATSLNFSFKYAFARKDTSNTDKLQLYTIQSCGGISVPRFTAIGAALETTTTNSNSAFYPTQITDWRQVAASIPPYMLNNTFRLKFVFEHRGGNNIFIDDINIDVNTGLDILDNNVTTLAIIPNPAYDNCQLSFQLNQPKTLFARVINVLGETMVLTEKKLYYEGKNSILLPTTHLINGIYFIELTDGSSRITKPLIINH